MSSALLVLVSEERKRYFPVVVMQSSSLATFSSVSPWRGGKSDGGWQGHTPACSFSNTAYVLRINHTLSSHLSPLTSHPPHPLISSSLIPSQLTPHPSSLISSSLIPSPSPLTSARENHRRMSVILVLTVSSCFSPLVTSRLVT